MRKIMNRTGVPVGADDSPPAPVREGSKDPGDSLEMSELDVGADRQNGEPPVDYAKLGEHVASVVEAAEVAAERIREEANREAATTLSEADRIRAEAEEATKIMREGAVADAEAKRREAEADAASVIASARQEEAREAKVAEERLATLQEQIESTEKRLNQLAGGLRNVAVQLEALGEAGGPRVRSGEDQTKRGEETLDESLRASIEA
jgi:type IV secretory pathway VirB10-like protein